MSAPAVAVLCGLAEAMVDAALEREDDGVRAFGSALERYRGAGALTARSRWRDAGRSHRDEMRVLRRLDRDLLEGLLDTARE